MTLKHITSVSRNLTSTDRSWESVVFQDGKSVLDSELNLSQEIARKNSNYTTSSGVVSVFPRETVEFDFLYSEIPNAFTIKSFVAHVAGEEIVVSGSNSNNPALNLITLPPPTVEGSPPDSKRTDFVFLEVWKQLVTPSSPASATFRLNSNNVGDIYLDGTANVGGGFVTIAVGQDYQIGNTIPETARNIRDAINEQSTSTTLGLAIEAETNGTEFIFLTINGGLASNNVVISTHGDILIRQPSGGTDGEGAPNATKIYPYGNTQADPSLFLDSDLIDTFISEVTTKRVQIQYRFRVFSVDYNGEGQTHPDGINPKTQYFGFDNVNVEAQGGQSSPQAGYHFSRASFADVVRADGETNSYPFTDSGLFFCGDGTEASSNALGAVDGYVYAIPICYVFRRSQGAFDPEHYANNALLSTHEATSNNALVTDTIIAVGVSNSDRPDGQFSDLIYAEDILDLRTTVFPHGFDYSSELVRQFQLLLDNQNNTWAIDSSDFRPSFNGSGGISTKPLVCDEIGRTQAHGGVGDTTQRGTFIREFDHIARRFSTAPVLERVIFEVKFDVSENYDGALSVTKIDNNNTGWYEGDIISLDISKLEASSKFRYWDAKSKDGLMFGQCAPTGTSVIDVLECWHDDGNSALVIDRGTQLKKVSGLGTDNIEIVLDRNNTTIDLASAGSQIIGNLNDGDVGSDRSVFITLVVEYPAKQGASATVFGESLVGSSEIYPTGAVLEYSRDQRQVDAFDQPPEVFFREGTREIGVELVGGQITSEFISEGLNGVRLPWRVHYTGDPFFLPTVIRVSDNFNIPIDVSLSKFGSSDTYLHFSAVLPETTRVSVMSYPRMPVSNYGASGYQIACYYRSISPQTCGSKATPINAESIEIQPIIISDKLWSITKGASTTEEGYPFLAPFEQLGHSPDVVDFSEIDLLGSTLISLEDFDVNTGLLSQHSLVPMDQTNKISLRNPIQDSGKRVVYRTVDSGEYMPSTYAKKLSENIRHKNATCMLGLVLSAESHFNKGEVVLVVLSRVSEPLDTGISDPSRSNFVALLDENDDTVACVYRTQGRVLNKLRKQKYIDVRP